MATFIQRLQLQGLQMLFFQQGEHHGSYVYHHSNGQRYVAKLITPMHFNMLKVQPETLDHFQAAPGIDGTPIYQRCWDDPEGLAILMDFATYTLRNFITLDNQIGEIEWYHIMFGIASQLVAAHEQGQIHKDLKPSNILVNLTEDSHINYAKVRITDWGMQPLSRTQAGNGEPVWPGTISYWAPEIKLMWNCATAATDMWAIGCIAYEICLGQQLSHNNNRAAIDNHIRGGPLDLSALDQRYGTEIRYIIHSCLELDPTRRWTAETLRRYIQNLFRQYGSYLFG